MQCARHVHVAMLLGKRHVEIFRDKLGGESERQRRFCFPKGMSLSSTLLLGIGGEVQVSVLCSVAYSATTATAVMSLPYLERSGMVIGRR
jgi:hypothetical protein